MKKTSFVELTDDMLLSINGGYREAGGVGGGAYSPPAGEIWFGDIWPSSHRSRRRRRRSRRRNTVRDRIQRRFHIHLPGLFSL